jgi:hypothetical protein
MGCQLLLLLLRAVLRGNLLLACCRPWQHHVVVLGDCQSLPQLQQPLLQLLWRRG